ncbi:transporter substrate-binding domain-containing protein [Pseudomonas shirazica]|nr:transporter substrate-binding domain-containing protein [Pseudomonas shirazica]
MVNFSNPIFQNTYTMVCKKGYPEKTWEQFNAPDAKISVDVGSSMDNFVTSMLPKASISRLESTSAATMALQSGRVDCQVLVVLLAQPLLKKFLTSAPSRCQNPCWRPLSPSACRRKPIPDSPTW